MSKSTFDVKQVVADKIIAELEKGNAIWRKPWKFSGAANAHRNFASKRPYTGINPWLLEIEAQNKGYEHPYWVTFKGATTLGGSVRKGEHGTFVTFWKRLVKVDETTGEKKQVFFLRYYKVFNIAQCDGLPEPEPITVPADFEPIKACENIVKGYPAPPKIKHDGKDSAFYVPAWDSISMPRKGDFKDRESYYHTLFHEMTHSTGHEKRLNRKDLVGSAGFGSVPYSREELVAEMGAAMLCGTAGIDPQVPQSAAYIKSWLKALKDDKSLVISAAARAQHAADHILGIDRSTADDES